MSTLVFGGLGLFVAAQAGLLGSAAKTAAGHVHVGLAPLKTAAGERTTPCPSAEELATKLGVSVYKVRTGMAQTGKDGCTLEASDLSGIPEVPAEVDVNGVPSFPNPQGPPATFDNPTGGSGTWGGLTDSQIQAAFLASNGNDPAKAAAAWAAQHAADVAAHGY